ncbi:MULTISPECIES: MFS transporter [Paraburkholderia]|uniref:Sugar phosphate permease n=1 Tax=Paraburkholderia tropica TaxID=92647 RepID=A0A1A5XCG5_9BURK|nr:MULTISPECIES: MFS transporter [Paraburkholderia]MBB2979096.1 MFS family permease [Paraburkholderia tropica]MBB2999074.1 MFS family permease [Paraburkholderia tropica]MBB6319026.1 MFS family permease [Paraburkholderia tropica]OBR51014.1 MFS transporter [Paraburkholderia tropica]QNB13024.1 MFS transporter [Paraburkholderia tropica]
MQENPLSASGFKLEKILPGDVKRATVVAFFAWVFAVYDFILFGTLLPEIGRHYNWDAAAQAEIATLVAVGTAVIAFAIGPVLDRLGRRAGLLWTVAGAAVCSGLTVVGGAMGQVPLVLIRSLSGLGYAEETVNATYLNELYAAANDPKLNKRKGFIYSLVQGGWPIGALLASALTALLLPRIGWQGCFIFATFPAIVIFFMTRRLKESPQFLLHKQIRVLRETGRDGEARTLAGEHRVDYEEHSRAGIAQAFRGSALRATLVLGGGILLNWSAIQVFSVLGTTVLTRVHNVSFESSLLILVLSNVIGYCGYLTHGWIGDRIGRRNTLAIGWMLGGLAFAAMLLGPSSTGMVVALYSLGLFFLIGPYSAALFFIGESYPTAIRGTGSSIVHAMGPIGAILAGIGVTTLLNQGSDWLHAALWFGALPCFLSGLLVLFAKHVTPDGVQ